MRSASFIIAVLATSLLQLHATHAGQIMSHLIPHRHATPGGQQPRVSGLEWNSQVATGFEQRPLSPPVHPLDGPSMTPGQQQQHDGQPSLDQQTRPGATAVGCPTNDRVYLPDMQSFLIRIRMPYQQAMEVCRACGSELLLVDGSNVDRLRESFQSLGGLYGGQRFWIRSWFGQPVRGGAGMCPAVEIDPLMDSRLTRK
ncbi:hypothetical protein BGW42_005006 [Actinomortierella wolfii]|nr:hypothetical protein BGW42_005006 [Actinomortierella wolfii]